MHATNFVWHDSIYLRFDGEDYDLHNNFDFRQFTYDPNRQFLILVWEVGNGSWIPDGQPSKISLRIQGVTQFSFKKRDPEMPFSEDDCLQSFGYACDDEWVNGQIPSELKPEDDWRWSFIFQSGAELQVLGVSAAVEVLFPE